MIEQENQAATVEAETTTEESATTEETISLKKSDYESLNQTLGSLKRELKDLKKAKDEPKETSSQPESVLLEKMERIALRTAGITHPDDMELARNTAKKWGVDIDEVLEDEDFKNKLVRQQTNRSNVEATSGVRGDKSVAGAKNTPEYWMAKGTPPTPDQVPDRKARASIVRAMMESGKNNGKKFYND